MAGSDDSTRPLNGTGAALLRDPAAGVNHKDGQSIRRLACGGNGFGLWGGNHPSTASSISVPTAYHKKSLDSYMGSAVSANTVTPPSRQPERIASQSERRTRCLHGILRSLAAGRCAIPQTACITPAESPRNPAESSRQSDGLRGHSCGVVRESARVARESARIVRPFSGNLRPFSGNLRPFSGNARPFSQNDAPFSLNGSILCLSGVFCPFSAYAHRSL